MKKLHSAHQLYQQDIPTTLSCILTMSHVSHVTSAMMTMRSCDHGCTHYNLCHCRHMWHLPWWQWCHVTMDVLTTTCVTVTCQPCDICHDDSEVMWPWMHSLQPMSLSHMTSAMMTVRSCDALTTCITANLTPDPQYWSEGEETAKLASTTYNHIETERHTNQWPLLTPIALHSQMSLLTCRNS